MTRAGWASCEITPPLGLPMGGRGPRLAGGTEVLTPLQAGAVVLEDAAGTRAVLISLDLIGTDLGRNTELCLAIASAVGVAPAAVIVNSSHTHSGPMMGIERYATLQPKPPELHQYELELNEKLLRLAIEAARDLREVRVRWRDGATNIGINRRLQTADGVVMAPNPDGCYHRQLWTLELQTVADETQRCVLFSHGCHPVIVYGHNWTAISSEWPGRCRELLRKELGDGLHSQFFQGLAGNVRPRVLADFENRKFRKSTPQDVEDTAREIARDVLSTLRQPGDALELQLGAERSFFLAHRQPPPPRAHWEERRDSTDELEREMSRYWLSRYEDDAIAPGETQPWPIGLFRFAPEYSLVYVAGEPLCEWHAIFEEALPGQHLVSCGYTHAGAGYLPTDALLHEGGYEIDRSPSFSRSGPGALRPGLNEAVTRALHKLQAAVAAN